MSEAEKREVVVTDVDMPFLSMVRFMVKWSIAAIPAILILAIIGGLVASLTMGLVGSWVAARDRSSATAAAVSPATDPAGIAGSGKVYLDGVHMLFHRPGCSEVAKLSSPMQYDQAEAKANGYSPHSCMN